MKRTEAQRRLDKFRRSLRSKGKAIPRWLNEVVLRKGSNGEWFAVRPSVPPPDCVRLEGAEPILQQGALGPWSRFLGHAESRELILGSTWYGRYQAFEHGIAVWENAKLREDGTPRKRNDPPPFSTSFPIGKWKSFDRRARQCRALVAFFDLRGFTKWSKGRSPKQVQGVVEKLEVAFQDAFASPRWGWAHIFAKGLGDGLMVVAEEGSRGDARAFCGLCAQTVDAASKALPRALGVGCGVASGRVTQLYLLGRYDYIGSVANDSAKIQQVSDNNVCVTTAVATTLGADIERELVTKAELKEKKLESMHGRVWRVPLEPLLRRRRKRPPPTRPRNRSSPRSTGRGLT